MSLDSFLNEGLVGLMEGTFRLEEGMVLISEGPIESEWDFRVGGGPCLTTKFYPARFFEAWLRLN